MLDEMRRSRRGRLILLGGGFLVVAVVGWIIITLATSFSGPSGPPGPPPEPQPPAPPFAPGVLGGGWFWSGRSKPPAPPFAPEGPGGRWFWAGRSKEGDNDDGFDRRGIIESVMDDGEDGENGRRPPEHDPAKVEAMLGQFADHFTGSPDQCQALYTAKSDALTDFFDCFVQDEQPAVVEGEAAGEAILERSREEHMDRFVRCLETSAWYHDYVSNPMAGLVHLVGTVSGAFEAVGLLFSSVITVVGAAATFLMTSPYFTYYLLPALAVVAWPLVRCFRQWGAAQVKQGDAYDPRLYKDGTTETGGGDVEVSQVTMWLMLAAFGVANQVLVWLFCRTWGLTGNLYHATRYSWTEPENKRWANLVRLILQTLRYVIRVQIEESAKDKHGYRGKSLLVIKDLSPTDNVIDLLDKIHELTGLQQNLQVLKVNDPRQPDREMVLTERTVDPKLMALENWVGHRATVILSVRTTYLYVRFPATLSGWGSGMEIVDVGPTQPVITIKQLIEAKTVGEG